jgi:membrane associated rhomboid family serine protease
LITLGKDGTIIDEGSTLVQSMWFVPEKFFQGQSLHTLITAAFLHGDWIHIISNMYFLWVFGDDSEDVMGRPTFIVFYLFCAAFASFFYALITVAITAQFVPLAPGIACVGASGAIFGVMAAYAIFFPNRTIVVPGWGRLTAKYYIAIYAIFEVVYTFLAPTDLVAHGAHVGGFLAGVFFAFAFRRLFQAKYQIMKTNFLPAGAYPKNEQAPAKIKSFFSRSKAVE